MVVGVRLRSGLCCFSQIPCAKRAFWLITKDCNRSCDYCYFASGAEKSGHHGNRDLVALGETADRLRAEGYNDILISGGEPLLVPNIARCLEVLAERGFAIAISTNGDFLSRDLARDFEALGRVRSVNLSLDSGVQSLNDRRRGEGAYRNTLRAVELSVQRPWRTRVTCVMDNWDSDAVLGVVSLVARLGVSDLSVTAPFPVVLPAGGDAGSTVEAAAAAGVTLSLQRWILPEGLETEWSCPQVRESYAFLDEALRGTCCFAGTESGCHG